MSFEVDVRGFIGQGFYLWGESEVLWKETDAYGLRQKFCDKGSMADPIFR